MSLGRGAGSPAQPASTGGAGEWRQVQSKGTARRAQRPQKSLRTGVSDASGFAQPGPRASHARKPMESCIR
eukprot:15413890-Alexandrium_andersonii.AAC.1